MEKQLEGKRLLITPASFEDAMDLQEAVADSLKGSRLDFKGLNGLAGDNLMETDLQELSGPIETIVGMALSVITSKRVKASLFKCCERVVYGDSKVDRDFFESVENRELYYPIMTEVVKVNLGPFFKRLGLLFGGQGNLLSRFLTSKSG